MKYIALATMILLTSCGRGYSNGSRTGTLSKFSNKGVFVKSYEGEVVMGGVTETGANVWRFSVRSAPLASDIAKHVGERMTLTYTQWITSPMDMESDYEVIDYKLDTP